MTVPHAATWLQLTRLAPVHHPTFDAFVPFPPVASDGSLPHSRDR